MARYTLATSSSATGSMKLQAEAGDWVDTSNNEPLSNTTTTLRLSKPLEVWLVGGISINDSANQLVVSGAAITDKTLNNISVVKANGADFRLTELDGQNATPVFGSTSTVTFAVTMSGLNAFGTLSGSKVFTVPERPYAAPITPAVSINDTTATCTGRQGSTTSDKYWKNTDWQLETDGVAVTVAANAAGSKTSHNYTALPNKRFRMLVRAKNDYAVGEWGASDYWYGPPSAPVGLTATRSEEHPTTVNLSWTITAPWTGATSVYRQIGDGPDVWLKSVPGGVSETTDTLDLSLSATYYVITETPRGANLDISEDSASVTVGTGYVPPTAATNVTLTTLNDSGTEMLLSWDGNVTSLGAAHYWRSITWWLAADSASGWGDIQSGSGLANTAKTLPVTGLPENGKYRCQIRPENSAGVGPSAFSGPCYSRPSAPVITSMTRSLGAGTLDLMLTRTALWSERMKVEVSLNAGDSWSECTSAPITGGVRVFGAVLAASLYRVTEIAPGEVASLPSASFPVAAAYPTDKTKIPGVQTIYAGSSKVNLVYLGSGRIWVDGE